MYKEQGVRPVVKTLTLLLEPKPVVLRVLTVKLYRPVKVLLSVIVLGVGKVR